MNKPFKLQHKREQPRAYEVVCKKCGAPFLTFDLYEDFCSEDCKLKFVSGEQKRKVIPRYDVQLVQIRDKEFRNEIKEKVIEHSRPLRDNDGLYSSYDLEKFSDEKLKVDFYRDVICVFEEEDNIETYEVFKVVEGGLTVYSLNSPAKHMDTYIPVFTDCNECFLKRRCNKNQCRILDDIPKFKEPDEEDYENADYFMMTHFDRY